MATPAANGSKIIRRPDRGLSIDGTRKTLYQVMDYVKAGRPASDIRDEMLLTDEQVAVALQYIATHREEVEAEYQQVLREAEEERQYWEERNKEHFARVRALPPDPRKEELREKLRALRARIDSESSP